MLIYLCVYFFFFFNDTATTEIYTLSLHDALPISEAGRAHGWLGVLGASRAADPARGRRRQPPLPSRRRRGAPARLTWREPGQRPDARVRSPRVSHPV